MKWLNKIIAWFKRLIKPRSSKTKHKEMTLKQRKEKRLHEQEQTQKDIVKAIEQAQTWRNRALMARQQRNEELEQMALDRMWQFQVTAAKLQGIEPPLAPPRAGDLLDDFGSGGSPSAGGLDNPWRPSDPSRVPKKPLPFVGGNEVALPLPSAEEEGT